APAGPVARAQIPSATRPNELRQERESRFEQRPGRPRDEGASRRNAAPEPRRKEQSTAARDVLRMPERRREVKSQQPAQPGASAPKQPRAAHPRLPNQAAVHERSSNPRIVPQAQQGQTRLFMNVGAEMGVSESDIIDAIQGATGLPREALGKVDVRERHLFVNVATDQVPGIVAKLNRSQIKGRNMKVK